MGRKLEDKDKNNFKNLADELKPREQMASLPPDVDQVLLHAREILKHARRPLSQ